VWCSRRHRALRIWCVGLCFALCLLGAGLDQHAFAGNRHLFGSASLAFSLPHPCWVLGEGATFRAIKTTAEWFPNVSAPWPRDCSIPGSNVAACWALGASLCRAPILRADHRRGDRRLRGRLRHYRVIDLCWIIAWLASIKTRGTPRVSKRNSPSSKAMPPNPPSKLPGANFFPQTNVGFCCRQADDRLFLVGFSLFGFPRLSSTKSSIWIPAGRKYMIMMILRRRLGGLSIAGGWLAGTL